MSVFYHAAITRQMLFTKYGLKMQRVTLFPKTNQGYDVHVKTPRAVLGELSGQMHSLTFQGQEELILPGLSDKIQDAQLNLNFRSTIDTFLKISMGLAQ